MYTNSKYKIEEKIKYIHIVYKLLYKKSFIINIINKKYLLYNKLLLS